MVDILQRKYPNIGTPNRKTHTKCYVSLIIFEQRLPIADSPIVAIVVAAKNSADEAVHNLVSFPLLEPPL